MNEKNIENKQIEMDCIRDFDQSYYEIMKKIICGK